MVDMWIREEVSGARTSILDKWKKLQRMNQEQAMAKYMTLIKEWPGYGSTLFDVEVRKTHWIQPVTHFSVATVLA